MANFGYSTNKLYNMKRYEMLKWQKISSSDYYFFHSARVTTSVQHIHHLKFQHQFQVALKPAVQ